MSMRRQNDRGGNRSSRHFAVFHGVHEGYGRTDKPVPFADVLDFECQEKKLARRAGKDGTTATDGADYDGLDAIDMGEGDQHVLSLAGGIMIATPAEELLA